MAQATTPAAVLKLLDQYSVTPEQRLIIMEAANKPPEHRAWFVDQFTRNR
jgi:hypothetical protein